FDEIEKAHPDVFNVLLQILDDGRLTDSKGRVVDFKNTVLIMTSNLGSREIQSAAENPLVDRDIRTEVLQVLRDHFKPEFLNRIDDIVVFTQLGKEQISTIIDVQLEKLRKNLEERGITLELDQSARDLLVEEGYDPVYGARPLKRAIQSLIQNALAVKLLQGEITSGQTVRVSAENGEMKFTPIGQKESAGTTSA
ncbi:MAG TPA: AAA family ATPase, partial [Pyrinomonadaceae bacterium]